jgi:2-oxo-4-hydroxy-4-carboxy-5-ureidoimidazoline decarboxylase
MTEGLARFNALPAVQAERELSACCASPDWARAVAAGRPYLSVDALTDAAGVALADLPWAGVARALAAHPRIGQRATGAGREAAWSRREQSGMSAADAGLAAAMAEANRAYERRFGHLFLIFATGRSAADMLAAARERLGHDDATERRVVCAELDRIVRLRVSRLVGGG